MELQLSDRACETLKYVSTATLTTQLFRRGFRNTFMQGIAPLGPVGNPNLVGPAFTLRNIPAREDIDVLEIFEDPNHPQRRSIETIPAGYVLVQDCRGDRTVACCGSILVARLRVRAVAGMVADGPVRDSAVIAVSKFPVFCAGASAPTNIIKHHSVDINLPIGCGGVAVYPGDVIVGDADGVVVVPQHLAEEIAADASEQERMEDFIMQRIEAGAALPGTYPPNSETRNAYSAWKPQKHPDGKHQVHLK
ncbi:MAG TPA: ribonuclease activity regulator RraA [Candidatus Sulfotelmatobacter sp.]|jgi:regulator of RNase E activity RraA|nr:ribonuclease activity regulator RraA [Candidatus Sulfotelmatobacter sp.]